MRNRQNTHLLFDARRMQALHVSVQALVQDSILLMIRIVQDPQMPGGARRAALEHLREVSKNGAVSDDLAAVIRGLVAPATDERPGESSR
jgi:uncharacterized protein (UPF0147 family)